LAEEKDFCTLLNEQIIDERKAVEDYKLLLELFKDEVDLLLPKEKPPPTERTRDMEILKTLAYIQGIIEDETNHFERLESRRKALCEVKE